jgi:hypothetical protein
MCVNGLWSQRQLACCLKGVSVCRWHSCDVAVKCLNPNLLVPDGGMGSISKVSEWADLFGYIYAPSVNDFCMITL